MMKVANVCHSGCMLGRRRCKRHGDREVNETASYGYRAIVCISGNECIAVCMHADTCTYCVPSRYIFHAPRLAYSCTVYSCKP